MEIVHLSERRYAAWLARLGPADRAHVQRRLLLLQIHGTDLGMPNVRRVFGGAWELRTPSGIRLYFAVSRGRAWFVQYGNKGTQQRDIQHALRRMEEIGDDA